MIKGITIILIFYLLGSALALLLSGVVPGSVCGMLLLFAALKMRIVKPSDVKVVAIAMTDNMALFFVSIGVGVIAVFDVIESEPIVFIIVPVASAALVMAVVGCLQQLLERKFGKKL